MSDNKLPRRIEVEEALLQVSEVARACYSYPFASHLMFYHGNVKKIDEFISPAIRELAEAGLLKINIEFQPVMYDDEYRAWRETWEEIKDLV